VVKYGGWGGHGAEIERLRGIFKRRFGDQIPEFERAEAEGREQLAAWNRLEQALRAKGPDSELVLEAASELVRRWPFVEGKVANKIETTRHFITRSRVVDRESAVLAVGDHRLAALPPAPSYMVLVDETGDDFGEGGRGQEGRFVAVIAPEGTLKPVEIHAANAAPEECDRVLQTLLDSPAAVLGVRLSDLPQLPGNRWQDGVLELLFWIVRVLPLPGDNSEVRLEVVVEARGAAQSGDHWPEVTRALLRSLQMGNPDRARRLQIEIRVSDKKHPLLGYPDVVAHAWAGRSFGARSRLHKSGLLHACLPTGNTRCLREAWDSFGTARTLSMEHWHALLADPDARERLSLAGTLLEQVGCAVSKNPDLWARHLEATRAHLDSKRIDLDRLSGEVSWLARWQPAGSVLPVDIQFLWDTAVLAHGNHHGGVDPELGARLAALGDRLLEEQAPLVCWADLHRAVSHTNRFEFQEASEALGRWREERPRVVGLQLWGRLRSSLGQHAAFVGDHARARTLFGEALDAFGRLLDAEAARRDAAQTGTYLAINEMDDPAASADQVRAALERVLGPLAEAVPRLARSAEPGDPYAHHLLLRWMVTVRERFPEQARTEADTYLCAEPAWRESAGHPWPLILCYRALLLPVGRKSLGILERAVDLAWAEGQKGTVRLIGAAIAVLAESRGGRFPALDAELDGLEKTVPAARSRIDCLRDWREQAGGELDLFRRVLPFNFH
jgi:hypothetical protein